MNASVASPLLFNWSPPRQRNRAIIGFLLASLAAHVAGFYIFQIVYPPTVSLTPAPQRVNLVSAVSDEGATLLRWVDAEDPALVSTTRRPSDARRYLLGKIEHIPSYFASEPALQSAPLATSDLRVPSAQSVGPVSVTVRSPAKPIGTVSTTVTFSRELESLGRPNFDPANFRISGNETPQNAQFRIAVDPQGVVRYCFPLNSSGDTALDEQARQHLVVCRFPANSAPNDEALVWGIATIEWGNDIGAANSKPFPHAP